jgi:type IV secretion system protein VirB10
MSRETELEDTIRPGAVIHGTPINKKLINIGGGVLLVLVLTIIFVLKSSKATEKPAARDEIIPAEVKPAEQIAYVAPEPSPAMVEKAEETEKIEEARREIQQRQAQAAAKRVDDANKLLQARLHSPVMIGYEPDLPAGDKQEEGKEATSKKTGPQTLGKDSNSQFLADQSGKSVPVSEPWQITNLEYKILQGKYIPIVVDPRAISDLAGQICARVDNDVYGAQGRVKLIPWGAQICGVYRAQIKQGQSRVFIVWNRLVREDGLAINIDSPGVDQLGTAGMGGDVDNHFAQIFGNALLISIIGKGSSTMGVNGSDNYNSAAMLRSNTQDAFSETADSILSQYTNIPPTITTPAGSTARIYVRGDLDFSKFYIEPEQQQAAAAQSYFDF